MQMSRQPRPLLTIRAALVLLLAVFSGLVAGVLTYLQTSALPNALLTGLAAAAAATVFFDNVID